MSYLYAAYIATWAIHITYLVILVRGITRLRAEAAEAESQSASSQSAQLQPGEPRR